MVGLRVTISLRYLETQGAARWHEGTNPSWAGGALCSSVAATYALGHFRQVSFLRAWVLCCKLQELTRGGSLRSLNSTICGSHLHLSPHK